MSEHEPSPVSMTKPVISRPAAPRDGESIDYRGWECGFNVDAAAWCNEGWEAYLGGIDLDAPKVSGRTWAELLDEIDEHDKTEAGASLSEPDALRELGLLYNHRDDDSPQFTRWQMIGAMAHGYRLASGAKA